SIILRKGAGAFVCGEETALISSIEGKRGMPRFKPPFPAQKGLFGKPTVINNVETLANLPIIMASGPQKFASVGTQGSKGTKIFAISGKSKYTGLIEVPMGTTLRSIVFDIGGGVKNENAFKALHIGGPSGYSLPDSLLDLPVDYDEMKKRGLMMGSGGITVLDQCNCIVDMVRHFTRFMLHESCGKCIPCREGTRRMADVLDTVVRRAAKDEKHFTLERFKGVTQLEGLSEVMKATSLCGLGKTAPNPVLGSLKWFRDEFEEHLFERKCRAAVCRDLRTFFINTEACTGCTVCAVKCPEQAIIGSSNNPHFIIEDKCTGCGVCIEVCRFSAVFVK
ncbi:MAG TPA: NADH-ubiquinone oxidoreductase-F iron-sulfur binding region domain-containing protein, partial [Bacteroidales bacterium]|nr:NADH-ubiquinone oxidoreductase-F iron-sulfur binding region domain-containing protein [Bacteroidales bacterium]